MNIEMWYDPVLPETTVRINGSWIDSRDPYGFLYPVRYFPMQGWLHRTGSWPGLDHQISDIARGEETNLVFYGRSCDYTDFADAMAAYNPRFQEWDTLSEWQERLDSAGATFQRALKWLNGADGDDWNLLPEAAKRICQALAPVDGDEWLATVTGEDDFKRALQRRESCCEINGEWLSSFSQMEMLMQLTRPMRRFPDMICCVMENESALELFSDYAAQFPRLATFRFCTGEQWPDVRKVMRQKYGIPLIYRVRAKAFRDTADFLTGLASNYETVSDRLSRLQKDIADTNDDASKIQEEETLRLTLQFLTVIRRDMPEVLKLLSGVDVANG